MTTDEISREDKAMILLAEAAIALGAVKAWRDSPDNDGFPVELRQYIEDWLPQVDEVLGGDKS